MPVAALDKAVVQTMEYIARESRLILEKGKPKGQQEINLETGEIEEDKSEACMCGVCDDCCDCPVEGNWEPCETNQRLLDSKLEELRR
ncbi:hypothetical protein Ami103574_04355 [Aminipila butyrica]|uniref:Uncharacterized protein n=1 Tax=Aminipila butyrica TaxID=433296 RepID=A0A858BTT2_9FIRM|nr:hypothetical protein [Aminipila butyrica]QIB68599.1 hypothetical protein Ami103574_04355 [Aminipila butyrica]